MTTKFETKPGRHRERGLLLWRARQRAGLSVQEAAARLELPVLRYAMAESGDVDFERDGAWDEAVAIVAKPRAGERA
jgi:hypothetical protein